MSLRARIERLEREAVRLMPPSAGLWDIGIHPESSIWAMGYPPGVWWNGDLRMPGVEVILRHGEKPDAHLMAVLTSQLASWGKIVNVLGDEHYDGGPAPAIPTPPPGWGYQAQRPKFASASGTPCSGPAAGLGLPGSAPQVAARSRWSCAAVRTPTGARNGEGAAG
jgi:hypothetical protein